MPWDFFNSSGQRLSTAARPLKSTVTYGSRAAATATGSGAYTGAGFTPTAVIIVAQGNTQDNISFGFGDDANAEQSVSVKTMNGTHVMERNATNIIMGISGSDSQVAVLTSLDADGITLGWTKANSGEAVNFVIYYMR